MYLCNGESEILGRILQRHYLLKGFPSCQEQQSRSEQHGRVGFRHMQRHCAEVIAETLWVEKRAVPRKSCRDRSASEQPDDEIIAYQGAAEDERRSVLADCRTRKNGLELKQARIQRRLRRAGPRLLFERVAFKLQLKRKGVFKHPTQLAASWIG